MRRCFAVRWKGTPIQKLATRRGNWKYSQFYALVDTAHEWGRDPSALGLCLPDEDVAIMQVYTDTTNRMRAQESLAQEQALKRKRKTR